MNRIYKYLSLFLLLVIIPARQWGQNHRQIKVAEFSIHDVETIEDRVFIIHYILEHGYFCYKNQGLENIVDVYIPSNAPDELSDFDFFYDHLLYSKLNEFKDLDKSVRGELFVQWRLEIDKELYKALYKDFTKGIATLNATCETAEPFCANNGAFSFAAGVNSGSPCGDYYNDYCDEPYHCPGHYHQGTSTSCLSTAPNPAFYYLKTGESGNLDIKIYSSPRYDIDFDCWGPFDNLEGACDLLSCDTMIDCSYQAGSGDEHCYINNAQVGQYYILLITNYSNQPCNIIYENVGTGDTDCAIGITSNTGPYCVGDTIVLNVEAQEGSTFNWTGPNGFTSTLQSPTLSNCTLAMAGTYTCVTSYGTQIPSTSHTEVEIFATPIASFTFDEVCSGTPTHFTCTSTTNPSGQTISGYQWNFGDGGTSTQQNPTHTYSQGGTYSVTLTVNCGGICTDATTQTVTVNASPTVNAGPDQTIAYGSSTQLNGSGGTGNFTYQWSPENMINGASNIPNPQTVNLTATQTYTLTVTNPDHPECNGTDQVTIFINGSAMTVSATANPPTICVGSSTQLTANAGGGTGSFTYSWLPTTGLSNPNIASPTASPTQTTTYTCTVSDGQTSQTATVTVTVAAAPTANFTYTTACEGSTTLFTSTATGQDIGDYQWDFGDGQTGDGQNVSHIYAQAGSYTVTHTVSSLTAGCTGSITQSVPVNPLPTANFTYTTVCSGTPTQFTSTSTGQGITNYQWIFGDGQTGTGQNPTHTYAQAGTYQVTLTVGNGSGTCDDDITQTVTVNAPPVANFNYTTVCQGSPTQFTSTATGQGITNYLWNFGDSQTGTGQNASHTYAQAGTYTVTHTVSTSTSGCEDQNTQQVTVGAMPIANAGQDQTISYGGTAQLSGSGGNGTFNFHWEPANKVVNANQQNTQTVALYDTQTFTLTVTNPQTQQCVDESQVTIHIQGSAMTVTASPNATICQGGNTMIQANAGGGTGNFSFSWAPTTGLSNSHIYNPVASPMQTTTYTCTVTDGQTTQSVSTTVFVNDVIVEHEYMTICPDESVQWHGNTYNTAGVYEYTTVTPEGCQETIYLHLDLYPEYYDTPPVYAEICHGETFYYNGNAYNASGSYSQTLQTVHDCDSIVTLNLTVWPENETFIDSISICESQSLYWHGNYYNQNGQTAVFDTIDNHGCPLQYRLELSVGQYQTGSHTVANECYPHGGSKYYLWEIPEQGWSQPYYDDIDNESVILPDPEGNCDILYSLSLHFMEEPVISDTTVEACNGYYWPVTQQTYHETGIYTHTVSSAPFPCDKLYRLNLTISHQSIDNDTLIECNNLTNPYCNVYPFYHPYIGDTLYFQRDIDTLLSGHTPEGCDYKLNFHLRNLIFTPNPIIKCSDGSIEFPNHPITATEFNVNRYTYHVEDNISDISTWFIDSCRWSISKPSWPIVVSDDNLSCTVYAMDWVPDTIWLCFKAVSPCNNTIAKYSLVPSFYGIEEAEAYPANVSIMPNPNKGQMRLRFENMEGRIGIKVYTLTGALIDSFEVTTTQVGDTYEYSMKRFQNGVYFFVISDGKRSVTKKVVIIW